MSAAFVDSHVHFWDQGRLPYPWLAAEPKLGAPHTPAALAAEAGADRPARMVFVQAECARDRWLDEVRWVESLAATEPRIAGIVAHVAVDAGAELPRLLAELGAHPRVRGVRHLIQGEADPQFCTRAAFVAGVQELGRRGLSFDLCCRHHQLTAVVELVRLCPQTRFVLDHAGKPAIARRELDPWRDQISALAALPNVDCKFSGLITEAAPGWTPADLRPYADHLLATFGPARLLFGSDWPVVKLAGSYPAWLETARALLSALSPAERDAIFSSNANRVYRLS
jgi:L-fuconolactonase